MTSISLNQEFDGLVKATLPEKQLISKDNNKNNNSNNNNNNNKENGQPEMTDKLAKSLDFFQSNKPSSKRTDRKYTITCIKSKNFLSNISYVRINKEDFYNQNFIFNICVLMNKNLNPLLLDRELNDPNKHEIIYIIWKECMATQFCKFICKEENFLYLNGKNILQPKVLEILTSFLAEDEKNYVLLGNNFSQYNKIFQYVYSNVFSEIYCATDRRGFDLKITFHIVFKTYKDTKNWAIGKAFPKLWKYSCRNLCIWTKTNKNWWFQWGQRKRS